MFDYNLSAPTVYLTATDARLFEALWRNATISEQNTCAALQRLNHARVTYNTYPLSAQTIHTADVCWTLQQQGLPTDLGLAPLLASQAGIEPAQTDVQTNSPATWMRLTPVHWAAARDHVNLHELDGDSMDVSDWRHIAQTVTPWLNELGWEVFVLAHQAYIRIASNFDYRAPSLTLAQSDILERFLPQGADLKTWQTLLTELQMLLHSHPVNAARAQRGTPPINSFWLDQTAQAAQFSTELWTQTVLTEPKIQRIDYEVSLAQLAQQLHPIAEQLRIGKKAVLNVLTDQPNACVHQFEFMPASLWQKLTAQFSGHSNAPEPFSWLFPILDEVHV